MINDSISKSNLSDFSQLANLFSEFRPDRIFHLAAVHFSSTSSKKNEKSLIKEMESCHIDITKNILEWQRHNPNAKSLIGLSSQMFSSGVTDLFIDEDSALNPSNDYSRTKAEGFRMLMDHRRIYGTKCYGAILFNHTSKRSKSEFLFPQLSMQIYNVLNEKSSDILVENSDVSLDICSAEEICAGMMKLIELPNPTDMIFSSGSTARIKDIIVKTMLLLGFQDDYNIVDKSEVNSTRPLVVGDPSRAQNLIGWKATKKPEEILAEMVTSLNERM
jgi:GDPmannose 4,6-dehydratase